jgi:L-serine dehydratase
MHLGGGFGAMRFKDVFSIIGPSMVGPSSSHTAGAVRLGRVARQLLGELPERAEIAFYGSFADTYQGHGTDLAVVAGILDYDTDDPRIAISFDEASRLGVDVAIRQAHGLAGHPNTAEIRLVRGTREVLLKGASIGGGNIEVEKVNDFDVRFTGMYPSLLLFHADRKGMIADITAILAQNNINIGHMDVDRKGRNGEALTVIESDNGFDAGIVDKLLAIPDMTHIRTIDLTGGSQ